MAKAEKQISIPSKPKSTNATEPRSEPSSPASNDPETIEQAATPTKTAPAPQHQDFESWYLQRVTAEFADDIDKVRNARDFTEASVPMLVHALKQGAQGFNEEERRVIMGGSL